jgi:hypothetical protein
LGHRLASTPEYDGLVPVAQGAVFEVKADRFGQHAAFDVAALAHEVVGPVGMGHGLDILMDDRPSSRSAVT